MSKNGRDRRPYLPPVTRIELSEDNIKLRWILLAVLVVIAAVSFGYGVRQMLTVQPGWNAVEATCDAPNYSSEFTFMYDFSESGGNAAAVNKQLTGIYSTALEDAFRIFSKDADVEAFHNLQDLNGRINEEMVIHPNLYDALEVLTRYNNRCIFLAPVYVEYNRVFNSESEGEALVYDPQQNPEVMEFIRQAVSYTSDENHIRLELLGENTARLAVSEEYRAFAQEMGIEEFLDFGWMRNAFVADYLASQLAQQGFTKGYLASFDGFTCNLGANDLSFNLYDRQDNHIYVPGKLIYSGSRSMVFLRDYPLSEMDRWNYRVYQDGRIVSALINPLDGTNKNSVANLVSYSRETGCAEVLMEMLCVYMADTFEESAVMNMAQKGIYTIWCEGNTVCYNDADLQLETVRNEDGVIYTKQYMG